MNKIDKFWPLRTFSIFLVVGIVLMTLAYLIPTEPIQKNVLKSLELYQEQGEYPRLLSSDPSTTKDNITDFLMLDKAMYSNQNNALITALLVPNEEFSYDNVPINKLTKIANGKKGDLPSSTYARYWHGYLTILKPLLVMLSPQQIYLLNFIVLLILIGTLVYQICNKVNFGVGLAYLLSMLFMNPISLAGNFQFMTSSLVCLIISEWIILKGNMIFSNKEYNRIFFISGILTSFFDLLTFPIITLGMPMLLYLSLALKSNKNDYSANYLKYTIYNSIWWVLGYALMWSSKWILASLLTDQNIIFDASNAIVFRTSEMNEGNNIIYNRMVGLISNISTIINSVIFRIIIATTIIFIVVSVIKKYNNIKNIKHVTIMDKIFNEFNYSCAFVACFPIVWSLVLNNHSTIHHWFTFRIFSVSLFGILIIFNGLNQKTWCIDVG